MDKEQQIEELTKLIQAKEIHPCDDDVHCEDCYCACKGMAEMIYKAGYRKVPKGSFICSGSETNLDIEVCNNCEMQQADELFERDKEIEHLKAENKQLQEQLNSANAGNVNCSGCGLVETNAVKEFARKVKNCSYCDNVFMDGKWHRYVFVDDIDKLLKEYEK